MLLSLSENSDSLSILIVMICTILGQELSALEDDDTTDNCYFCHLFYMLSLTTKSYYMHKGMYLYTIIISVKIVQL